MKIITLFTLLLGCILFIPTDVVAQTKHSIDNNAQSDNLFYHTIERGQTIYSIAAMYSVSVEEILKLNAMTDDAIKVGATLKIPQKKKPVKQETSINPEYMFHTIEAKETLFGVAKKHSVTGQQIIDANPGLSQETFSIGKTIRIPTNIKEKKTTEVVDKKDGKEVYYTVPEKETLYNICKQFKTSEEELMRLNPELSGGLRKNMTLRIPLRVNIKELPAETSETPKEVNEMLSAKPVVKPVITAKIAIFLPYDAENPKSSGAMSRFTEFYEGMLLAVDSLRKQGYSSEFFVYDIGEETDKLKKLLQSSDEVLKDVNLIIGGISNEQIKIIADFALKNKVKYVIPFTQKNDEVLNNAYVFQVNTPKEYLYANAAYAGANLFSGYNIIFLDTKDADPQTEFINEFKNELKEKNIPFHDANFNGDKFKTDITDLLSTTQPNMIMPVSSSLDALIKIKTVLRNINDSKPEYDITLFGYPVWQTLNYTKECLDDFHALNTYIYSLFYADNMSPGVKEFYNDYKYWFSKNPTPLFPKYAMLGFDTGMFFLQAIKKYGANFDNNMTALNYKSLQTGFNFERVNNWGGFINTNIYMIHFSKDYKIIRT
ncbi:MAG: LysM peptidoglycan-binding domain-containing protein, partial [Tannerella sp.]|nr:LysM peptidoglycan-binding domain-containing protein [Tannerella sp.]